MKILSSAWRFVKWVGSWIWKWIKMFLWWLWSVLKHWVLTNCFNLKQLIKEPFINIKKFLKFVVGLIWRAALVWFVVTICWRAYKDDKRYYVESFDLPEKFIKVGITGQVASAHFVTSVHAIMGKSGYRNEVKLENLNHLEYKVSVADFSFAMSVTKMSNALRSLFGKSNVIELAIFEGTGDTYLLRFANQRFGAYVVEIERGELTESEVMNLLGWKGALQMVTVTSPVGAAYFYNAIKNPDGVIEVCSYYLSQAKTADSTRARLYVQAGLAFGQRNDSVFEKRQYENALKFKDKDASYWAKCFQAGYSLGRSRYREAKSLSREAMAIDSLNWFAKYQLAMTYALQGKYDSTTIYLDQILRRDSMNLQALIMKGLTRLTQGKDSVGYYLDKAGPMVLFDFLTYNPYYNRFTTVNRVTDKYTAYFKGRIRFDSASFYFKKSLTYDPKFFCGLVGLASVELMQNNKHGAIQYLIQCQQYYPGSVTVNQMLGAIYVQLTDVPSAQERFQRGMRDVFDLDVIATLGTFGGRSADSEFFIKRAEIFNPYNRDLLGAQMLFFLREKDNEEALRVAHKRLEIAKFDDERFEALRQIALVYEHNEQFAEAIEVCKSMLRLVKGDRLATDMMAKFLLRLERNEEAYKLLYSVGNPTYYTYALRGWCNYNLFKLKDAMHNLIKSHELIQELQPYPSTGQFEDLFRLQGEYAICYRYLAHCNQLNDNYVGANANFKRAMQFEPYNCDILIEWEVMFKMAEERFAEHSQKVYRSDYLYALEKSNCR
jgi:tetratricopeptide (TPR) repeat protein